jgi:hypothetical protein
MVALLLPTTDALPITGWKLCCWLRIFNYVPVGETYHVDMQKATDQLQGRSQSFFREGLN